MCSFILKHLITDAFSILFYESRLFDGLPDLSRSNVENLVF